MPQGQSDTDELLAQNFKVCEYSKLLAQKSKCLSPNWVLLTQKLQGLSDTDKLLTQNLKGLGDNDDLQNGKLLA